MQHIANHLWMASRLLVATVVTCSVICELVNLVTTASTAKMAELLKMPLGLLTDMGPRNRVLVGMICDPDIFQTSSKTVVYAWRSAGCC